MAKRIRHALDFTPHPALVAAEKALGARKGPPTEDDAPPPSLFPMTPGAKEALRFNAEKAKRTGSK